MRPRLPHPLIMLVAGVAIAAGLTWILPAGEYTRRDDPATHRSVVVVGTYHAVPASPVGPFAAVVSIPRGFIEGADVIAVVLFVGGAWVVIDRLGVLGRLVASLVGAFRRRGLIAIPVVALFFAVIGALENMQEEIIPLVPVLLLLGAGVGVDAVGVVAMSAGAAMIGSAFGPTNPFQAGIAMKLAQLPPTSAGLLRLTMFAVAVALWIVWTVRHAIKHRMEVADGALRLRFGRVRLGIQRAVRGILRRGVRRRVVGRPRIGGYHRGVTPTNGALMAVLLAARVPYGRWIRFALPGAAIALLVGVLGMGAAMATS